MGVQLFCKKYFHPLSKESGQPLNKTAAFFKIASMFTVIVPLIFLCTWGVASLAGRIKNRGKPKTNSSATHRLATSILNPPQTPKIDENKGNESGTTSQPNSGNEKEIETSQVPQTSKVSPPDHQPIPDPTATSTLNPPETATAQSAVAPKSTFNATLDQMALDEGYGYKAANLMILEELAKEMSSQLKNCQVKVPSFCAVSDKEIREHLGDKTDQIDSLWAKFLTTFPKPVQDPLPSEIPEEGRKILAEIRNLIATAFQGPSSYTSGKLQTWLSKEPKEKVIVRSTGKEDSETNSNAGGNESIPFISPQEDEISATMGRVIGSYFSEKSILQRLQSNDTTLFTETKPFMPVLIQEMVLEPTDPEPAEVLRSGVLLTYETGQNEKVTLIQTGLGNNEGIVTSQVAVDSYHVDDKMHIHSVVRDKSTRFVQAEENGKTIAKEIENSDASLSRSQALTNPMIRNLKSVANSISNHYGNKAMDVEYSVKLKSKNQTENVIYLFQARPLVQPQVTSVPSYLSLSELESIKSDEKMSVPVLVDARHSVRTFTNDSEALFANSLREAYNLYLKDPGQIQTVFVRKNAPSTSHEAIVLRSRGIAVVVLSDPNEYAKAEEWIESASNAHPVMLDTQHGVLLSTHSVQNPGALIKEGTISYPMTREASIPQAVVFNAEGLQLADQRYQKLIKALLGDAPLLETNGKDPFTLHRLLDRIGQGEPAEAKRALATLLTLLRRSLEQNAGDSNSSIPYRMVYINLFHHAVKLAQNEILPAIEHAKGSSMERLYPLKFLETILFQQPSEEGIATDSFAKLLHFKKKEAEAMEAALAAGIQNPSKESAEVYMLGKKNGFSQEVIKKWAQFISQVPRPQELLVKVKTSEELGLFTAWLNTDFDYMKDVKLDVVLEQLHNKIEEINKTGILSKFRQALPKEAEIKKWAHPQFAENNLEKLQKMFEDEYGFHETFPKKWNAAKRTERYAYLQFMREAMTTLDLIIKEVAGSDKFNKDIRLKLRTYGALLQTYQKMMVCFTQLINEKYLVSLFSRHRLSFEDYLKGLTEGKRYQTQLGGREDEKKFENSTGFNTLLQNLDTIENPEMMFVARPHFSVAQMRIGNKQDLNYAVTWPSTLEEYFTTFHQNMEFCIAFLMKKNGFEYMMKHDNVYPWTSRVQRLVDLEVDCHSISRRGSNLVLNYNIPLQQHAAHAELQLPIEEDRPILFRLGAQGKNEHNRWYKHAFAGAWMHHTLSESNHSPHGISIDWRAEAEDVSEASFQLSLNAKTSDEVFTMCKNVINQFTNRDELQQNEVLKALNTPPFEISKLNPLFFRDCLWGASEVLQQLESDRLDAQFAEGIVRHVRAVVKTQPKNPYNSAQTVYNFTAAGRLMRAFYKLKGRNPKLSKAILEDLLKIPNLKTFNPKFHEDLTSMLQRS